MDYENLEKLVIKAKSGDRKSKEEIFEEFKPFILNFSSKFFINSYDIYDIQNECYRILLDAINMYKPEKHRFVAYATNAIKNSIYLLIRRSKTRNKTDGNDALTLTGELNDISDLDDSYQDIFNGCDHEILFSALEILSDNEKALINFVIIKNKSLKEYAISENIKYTTAAWRKNSILKRMKEHIDKLYTPNI